MTRDEVVKRFLDALCPRYHVEVNEKGRFAHILGMGENEFEDKSWYGFAYWFEGIPEEVENATDGFYRTVLAYGHTIKEGDVAVVGRSGPWIATHVIGIPAEAECPYKGERVGSEEWRWQGSQRSERAMPERCDLCEELFGQEHGYIYIGDGWMRVILKQEMEEDDGVLVSDACEGKRDGEGEGGNQQIPHPSEE